MHIWVGIDVAKQVHWATAVDEAGEVRIDRAVPNSPAAIEALIADLKALNGEVVIGLDVIGGIAGLVTAMLAAAGFRLVHVPGLAVNRARQATTGARPRAIRRMLASSPISCGCAGIYGLILQ